MDPDIHWASIHALTTAMALTLTPTRMRPPTGHCPASAPPRRMPTTGMSEANGPRKGCRRSAITEPPARAARRKYWVRTPSHAIAATAQSASPTTSGTPSARVAIVHVPASPLNPNGMPKWFSGNRVGRGVSNTVTSSLSGGRATYSAYSGCGQDLTRHAENSGL